MKILSMPIQMIVFFDKGGIPTPMRFKINSEEPPIIIKVDQVIHKRVERFAENNMYIFSCKSVINDREKDYELKYDVKNCKWTLFRM